MSIEIVGQQKYDFQDMVCVYLILLVLSKYPDSEVSFQSEPANSEDALIELDNITIEIQIKGSNEKLDLPSLVDYLAHFPDRSAQNSLFERLLSDDRIVVFIISGRCDDDTATYLSKMDEIFVSHAKDFTRNNVTGLYNSFEQWKSSNKSALKQSREETVHSYKDIKSSTTKEALKRLIVVEQVQIKEMYNFCENLLLSHFKVPRHQQTQLINTLVKKVKESKLSGDIFSECKTIISSYKPNGIKPKDYILNNNEEPLYEVLCNQNILIITGSPRVGKTYTARYLASRFQDEGYSIVELSSIEEATRALLKPQEQVILLDDPLGSTTIKAEAFAEYIKLKKLIQSASSDKKVIIVQKEDILLEVSGEGNITKSKINGHHYHVLRTDHAFQKTLWKILVEKNSVNEKIADQISDYLSTKTIEAGCLEYLATNFDELPKNPSYQEIELLAYRTANDLSLELGYNGYEKLLKALYISTNMQTPVDIIHFQNIVNIDKENLLAVSKQIGKSSNFGSFEKIDNTKKIKENYVNNYELDDESKSKLDTLINKRFINFSGNQICYSHPFYRHSAEYFFRQTFLSASNITEMIKQALFCLSPTTSKATAKNISWIYKVIPSSENKKHLFELSIEALESSYPATRDICFEFLTKNITEHPEIEKDIDSWIGTVGFFSLDDVIWINGEPILPMVDELCIESDLSFLWNNQEACVDNPFTQKNNVSPEEAWRFICAVENTPNDLDRNTAKYLLGFNEGSLRAKTAKTWLAVSRSNDDEILEFIFEDSHPAVTKSIIQGCFIIWESLDDSRKQLLIEKITLSSSNSINAFVMFQALIKLYKEDEYHSENKKPTELLLNIFSPLIDNISKIENISERLQFNVTNLYSTIEQLDEVNEERLVAIFTSWVQWLEHKSQYDLPCDYELGITGLIFKYPEWEGRTKIIARLLKLHGTGVKVRVITDLVSNWSELSKEEIELIIECIENSQTDKSWLIASTLTHDEIPNIILEKFLPSEISSQQELCNLEDLDNELFLCAMKMYLGYQPLYYLGVSHRSKIHWKSSIEKIAINPSHLLFEAVWNDLFYLCNDESYLVSLVSRIQLNSINEFFSVFLNSLSKNTGEFSPNLMDKLFELEKDTETKGEWINKIALNINQIIDRWEEFDNIANNQTVKKQILEKLENDLNLLKLSRTFVDVLEKNDFDESSDTNSHTIGILFKLFEDYSPIHHETCSILHTKLQKLGADTAILNEIQNLRNKLIDESHPIIRDYEISKSDNWIK